MNKTDVRRFLMSWKNLLLLVSLLTVANSSAVAQNQHFPFASEVALNSGSSAFVVESEQQQAKSKQEASQSEVGKETASFSPEPIHALTVRELILELQRQHYRSVLLDQRYAEELITFYYEQLDPTRLTFLASEIGKLPIPADHLLLKLVKDGDITFFFEIYNRLHTRMLLRYQWLIDLCQQEEKSTTFDQKETIDLDRKRSTWPQTTEEADSLWLARHKHQLINLMLAGKKSDEALVTLSERYKNYLDRLKQVRNDDVFSIVANAISMFYDPHTQYLSPRDSENFAISMNLSLEGIGTVLQRDGEYTKIASVVPGGPADLSKLVKAGDRIVAVAQGEDGNWVDIIGWRLDDVVPLIRGAKGTIVRLEIIPVDAVDQHSTRKICIRRNEVKLEEQAAQKQILTLKYQGKEQRVGVIRVPTFYVNFDDYRAQKPDYRSTTRDVKQLLEQLDKEDVVGVVIDLRDNGGGSLEEAITMTGLFVPSGGPAVQIRYSNGRQHAVPVKSVSYRYEAPVVVLVNRSSASASEILAAALQDYRRAVVIGDRTFGKGTVQRIIALENGHLKYTNATFYRISGLTTQHQGVLPDIALPSYHDHVNFGESALERALPAGQIRSASFTPGKNWIPSVDTLQELHNIRLREDPDLMFLQEDAQRILQARQNSIVSLDYKTRLDELEQDRQARLEAENRRRKKLGLELLTQLSDEQNSKLIAKLDEENSFDANGVSTLGKDSESDSDLESDDVVLREAAKVLLDIFALSRTSHAVAEVEEVGEAVFSP